MNLSKQYIIVLLLLILSTSYIIGQQTGSEIVSAEKQISDSLNITVSDTLLLSDSLSYINDTSILLNDSLPNYSDSLSTLIDSTFIPWDSVRFSLNGYLFSTNDSIIIEKWNYNTEIHNFDFTSYDSTLREFHVTHPAFRKTINNTYLGNIGSAIKSNIYFEPNAETGYLFLNSYTPYLHQAKEATYYNVLKPFTKFEYQTGPRKEQNIDIIHTQNINQFTNAFAQFSNYSGEGAYVDQKTKNNSGIFGGARIKGRFATHVNYTFARISVEENGGISDYRLITDSVPPSTTETTTRLNEGENYMKDRQLFFDQKIGFIKSRKTDTSSIGGYLFSLQYNYHKQKSFRIYEDDDKEYYNPFTEKYQLMYANNYSTVSTFDTSSFKTHQHILRFNLEESPGNWLGFGAYIGAGKHYTNYSYYNKDTIFVNALEKNLQSAYFEGGIFRLRPSALNFFGHYQLFVNGYRKNDVLLSGMINIKVGKGLFQSEFSAEGKTESKTADYFLNKYRSNHFRWDNNFDKENVTELKGKYYLPNLNTTIGARYALLTNHIYFDKDGLPAQFSSDFNVFDAYLNNMVSAYHFNLITKISFQQSGKQEVLPLPDWSFYNALYFEYPIHFPTTQGNMKLQLGVDWHYWTKFYAPLYSPATAQFHTQNTQLVGSYPFIGAFLNLEIKRMRIYVKGEHVNYSYMKSHNMANYFMAPNYPTAKSVIKYGIAWTFYD